MKSSGSGKTAAPSNPMCGRLKGGFSYAHFDGKWTERTGEWQDSDLAANLEGFGSTLDRSCMV